MLHEVEALLSVPAGLTIVDVKRAVTDDRVQRFAEAIDIETISADHLPGEVAAGAETANIAFEPKFLAGAI